MMRRAIAIPALLILVACFDTQVAGTSTNTGNTISARVMLSDGRPASGAKVSVRESAFLPPGVPGYRTGVYSKDTVADASGFFAVTVPAGPKYFLSVYASGSETEAYWQDGIATPAASSNGAGLNDTVRLEKTAALSGHVLTGAADSIWLGFPGTSRFVLPQSDGSFILDSLPPGSHDLRVIYSGSGKTHGLDVGGWTVLPGATMILDTLVLPADTSIHTLSLPACRDTVDSIVFAAVSGHSRADRVFRSVMFSSPPEWVELDACLGQWSRKGILPSMIAGNLDLFAGPSGDYLILPDSNRILKRDSAGSRLLPTLLNNLAQADFHSGRFYAFIHLDSAIQSFPDEDSWLRNIPDRNFPRPAQFQRLAVGERALHFLNADSAGLSLQRYTFNPGSFHAPVLLPGFTGNCVGMATGSGDEVWLLDDAGELSRVNGLTGRLLEKAKVSTTDSMRGLAGGK